MLFGGTSWLGAFEPAIRKWSNPHLPPLTLRLGVVVCEAGDFLEHAYFREGSGLSLLTVLEARRSRRPARCRPDQCRPERCQPEPEPCPPGKCRPERCQPVQRQPRRGQPDRRQPERCQLRDADLTDVRRDNQEQLSRACGKPKVRRKASRSTDHAPRRNSSNSTRRDSRA